MPRVDVEFYVDGVLGRYSCLPITINEIEYVTTILRGKIIRAARESLSDTDSQEIRDETLDSAMRVAGKLNFFSKGNNEQFKKADGATLLLQICIKEPIVDLATVYKMLADVRNNDELMYAMQHLVYWEENTQRKKQNDIINNTNGQPKNELPPIVGEQQLQPVGSNSALPANY